jgi:pimeloyl-ACP methyl ester carboxylesterase
MTTPPSGKADRSVRQLRIADDAFPFIDSGLGAPVLFLHGALGDCRTWQRQCALLSARFRCIAYTQRYFGRSSWREDGPPFGTATHARDLVAFCEALEAGPVSLVAWSYAGHAALKALIDRPDLFARALVFEPGVPSYVTDANELSAFGADAQAMFGPVFEAAAQGDLDEAVRRLIDGSGGCSGTFERQSAARRAIEAENAHTMPLLLAQETPPPISCADLAGLRVPVTIAWGARSRPVFSIPSKAAARCIATAEPIVVPDVGHLWPDEDPEGFAALVERWLDAPV